MLFNSYMFVFVFLPLCLSGFHLLLKNGRPGLAKLWLTGFSLWFYGYFNLNYLLIMALSILGNYGFHLLLARKKSRAILAGGVALNLAVLFYFKYADFFLENLNLALGLELPLANILLPLGISFFTFQQISFLADTFRRGLGRCGFVDYALFVSFFPQLIAGPIVTHEEMLPQFARIGRDGRKREERLEEAARGILLFVLGLAKKTLIADTFGVAVDYAYANVDTLNGLESLLAVLFYSLQLYYDFSGYCDMARGLGELFGIHICANFRSPYRSANIIEFWKNWHITLSRFFTRNVYIPLGGNRRGRARTYLNLLLIFFLSGLWHGAGWNYVLWGMMHGLLYVLTRFWEKRKKLPSGPLPVALTFSWVSLAWVYFRAESVSQANRLLGRLFMAGWALPGEGMLEAFNLGEFWYALKFTGLADLPYSESYLLFAFTALTLAATFFAGNAPQLARRSKMGLAGAVTAAVLFIWCVSSLSGVSAFLYFNF